MAKADHILPWITQAQVAEVVTAFNNTHAVLITGPAAIGKSYLANEVCSRLFEQSVTNQADSLLEAGTHPDLHVLTSAYSFTDLALHLQNAALRYLDADALEKKRLSRQISVENVRALTANMNESAALAGYKLAVICPAENMNRNAANALLKFLEEPTDQTLIILVSHDISRLPATIRSRCMRLTLNVPTQSQSSAWLQDAHPDKNADEVLNALYLSSARPLLASQYLQDDQQLMVDDLINDIKHIIENGNVNIVATARDWLKLKQTDFILRWLCCFFSDLIKFKSGCIKNKKSEYQNNLTIVAKHFSLARLFELYDHFLQMSKHYDGVIDEALLFEDLLLTLATADK